MNNKKSSFLHYIADIKVEQAKLDEKINSATKEVLKDFFDEYESTSIDVDRHSQQTSGTYYDDYNQEQVRNIVAIDFNEDTLEIERFHFDTDEEDVDTLYPVKAGFVEYDKLSLLETLIDETY